MSKDLPYIIIEVGAREGAGLHDFQMEVSKYIHKGYILSSYDEI